MLNEETMNLKMTRADICKLMLATTHITIEAKQEQADENTSEERKRILEGTIAMWQRLHDEIEKQIDEFDEKHGF